MEYKMDLRMESVGFSIDLEYGSLRVAGDESLGFRPFQLMTASVAACSGGVLRNILKKQRIPLDNIRIEADVTRNEKKKMPTALKKFTFILFWPAKNSVRKKWKGQSP